MKKFLFAFALLSLTACCGCPKGGMMKPMAMAAPATTLACSTAKVSGMTCEACAASVTANLKKNPAIKDVKVDVAKGEVKIYTDKAGAVNSATVKKVVTHSGYTFQSMKAGCQ